MRWYLLKDRRHEGPFTKEQVVEGLRGGRIDPKDYLLPELADKDQSSFAYVTAGDVAGADIVFDLKKHQPKSFQHNTNSVGVADEKLATSAGNAQKLEDLKSEFSDGLESTQLVNLKNSQQGSSGTPQNAGAPYPSAFVSEPPSSGFSMPTMAVALVFVILAAVGAALKFDLIGSFSGSKAESTAAPTATATARTPSAPAARTPERGSRVPAGQLSLPAATQREEPVELASPSRAEPANRGEDEVTEKRSRRKSRRRSEDSRTESAIDEEEPTDSENNDGTNVQDDRESAGQDDEVDIR